MDFRGQDERSHREQVVPDGSGRYTAQRMFVREKWSVFQNASIWVAPRIRLNSSRNKVLALFGAFCLAPKGGSMYRFRMSGRRW